VPVTVTPESLQRVLVAAVRVLNDQTSYNVGRGRPVTWASLDRLRSALRGVGVDADAYQNDYDAVHSIQVTAANGDEIIELAERAVRGGRQPANLYCF
jgi:hypothetical protein